MREIKFRAFQDDTMYYQKALGIYAIKKFLDTLYEDCKLMMWTGSLDVRGIEIYEGDIITNEIDDQGTKRFNPKTGFYDYDKKKEIVVVRYNEHWGHFIFSNQSMRGKIEVIGNIYENPELLEAK